jgi:hypothetical protein
MSNPTLCEARELCEPCEISHLVNEIFGKLYGLHKENTKALDVLCKLINKKFPMMIMRQRKTTLVAFACVLYKENESEIFNEWVEADEKLLESVQKRIARVQNQSSLPA